MNDDPSKMNWLEEMANWGEPIGFDFIDISLNGNEIRSCYRQGVLELEIIRCHAHIGCGSEFSYVHARKIGSFPTDVALILTQGSLDCYGVERIEEESSNDRGDFVLHL